MRSDFSLNSSIEDLTHTTHIRYQSRKPPVLGVTPNTVSMMADGRWPNCFPPDFSRCYKLGETVEKIRHWEIVKASSRQGLRQHAIKKVWRWGMRSEDKEALHREVRYH